MEELGLIAPTRICKAHSHMPVPLLSFFLAGENKHAALLSAHGKGAARLGYRVARGRGRRFCCRLSLVVSARSCSRSSTFVACCLETARRHARSCVIRSVHIGSSSSWSVQPTNQPATSVDLFVSGQHTRARTPATAGRPSASAHSHTGRGDPHISTCRPKMSSPSIHPSTSSSIAKLILPFAKV